ncbi:MAG: AbrB/MazE/SpoVT family DNA-binding domain-containing protein [Clostridia bacterium]|jgi:antitoxin component of MazEF toxin-antitoxin module
MIMFKYTSKIGVANPKSNSLRVGLPKEIVQLLDVSSGDTLEWGVDVTNDKVTIIASKSK